MSFTSKDNFFIIKEQYQELLQAEAADQRRKTTVFHVYTQFNASQEECGLYVSSALSMGDFCRSQIGNCSELTTMY
ncbi:hypothetical protein DSO57_1016363, partial [Entomophthora muscae]